MQYKWNILKYEIQAFIDSSEICYNMIYLTTWSYILFETYMHDWENKDMCVLSTIVAVFMGTITGFILQIGGKHTVCYDKSLFL